MQRTLRRGRLAKNRLKQLTGGDTVVARELYEAFTAWAEANGEHAMSHTRLGRKLTVWDGLSVNRPA